MRVQEVLHLVNAVLESWHDPNFVLRKSITGTEDTYTWVNFSESISQLESLSFIPEISIEIDKIREIHRKTRFNRGSQQDIEYIRSTMHNIKSSLCLMQSLYKAFGYEQNLSGFDIKLPPNISLSEMSECTKDLNIVFSQCPLFHNEEEEIRLHGVDVGSIWLTFAIVSTGAATTFYVIKNLAAMVDKIIAIREHAFVCKQQEEAARQAKLKNDMLQSVIDSNKTIINSLTQNAVEEMAQENQIQSPEEIAQIRASFDILRKWITKGMEVYAAVEAPAEIKAAFPPLETQALPDFRVKELESHKDTGES